MMHISPHTERTLIDLANRGLWLQVHHDRLQVLATHEEAGELTEYLRHDIASLRSELLEVIPALDGPNLALTGAVVRVLFARLSDDDKERAVNLRNDGDMSAAYNYFTNNYHELGLPEKVIYLWAALDGPRAGSREENIIDFQVAAGKKVMA